jgi:hypothetical protein
MGRNSNFNQTKPLIFRRLKRLSVSAAPVAAALAFSACQTAASSLVPILPAKMQAATTSQACVAQMQETISAATGRPVVLTVLAFDNTDLLQITSAPLIGATGVQLNGRLHEKPHNFRLLKTGNTCAIKDERNEVIKSLPVCTCTAIA